MVIRCRAIESSRRLHTHVSKEFGRPSSKRIVAAVEVREVSILGLSEILSDLRPNFQCRSLSNASAKISREIETRVEREKVGNRRNLAYRSLNPSFLSNNDIMRLSQDILTRKSLDFELSGVKDATKCVKHWESLGSTESLQMGRKILLRLIKESPKPISHNLAELSASFMQSYKRGTSPDRTYSLAFECLKHLEFQLESQSHAQIKNSILSVYNIALDSLAKSNRQDKIFRINGALKHMEESSIISPDSLSYNSLLYAHSMQRSKNSAKQCEDFLRNMQRNPNRKMLVDTVSYNIVINAWGKSNDTHAANRATMILREMQERYTDGQVGIKPNLISFTSVINAWSRVSASDIEASQRAEEIFNLLNELSALDSDLRPNAFTFHAIMNAFSNSSLPGTATRAQQFLDKMFQQYKEGDRMSKPNRISFAICIKAWTGDDERGKSQKAHALLAQMQKLHKEGFDTRPDIGTFNFVIRAYANDNVEEKASEAENLLGEIENMNINPNLTTYNNVLRCCCSTRSDDVKIKRNAVRIATETLLKIQQRNIMPDPYTFNFFIKVCDRLTTGEQKLKLIKAAFIYCKKMGQFGAPVLSLLKNTLKPQELKDILQLSDDVDLRLLQIHHVPKEWSKRIKGQTKSRP